MSETERPKEFEFSKRTIEQFRPAIPTRGTKLPTSPDWIHEIKYDGFRLIVHRDGGCVRLLTRNGHNWADRYPWIVEFCSQESEPAFCH